MLSVIGNDTWSRGLNVECPVLLVKVRPSEFVYAVSFVPEAWSQVGSENVKPGVFENRALLLK